ncbi:uncharacterized protein YukE [Arthrobacter woluwensis]|nr:uncharacterized protein YukE [Arthrobacter woluwensis]
MAHGAFVVKGCRLDQYGGQGMPGAGRNELMGLYGADVARLRELSSAMDKSAELLKSRTRNLQAEIMNSPWKGQDARRFLQSWSSEYQPMLEKAINALSQNAKTLTAQAKEQEDASNSSGAGTGGGPGGVQKTSPEELTKSLEDISHATPAQQAAWWNALSDEDKKYLLSNPATAALIMKLDGGVPDSAQEQARKFLQDEAKRTIPVYKESLKADANLRVAWVHGGVGVSAEVVQNADGSATLRVSGKLGIGANNPTGELGATLNGEMSREYKFASLEEAMKARTQMVTDLPPDSFDKAVDATTNAPKYVLDTIDNAADKNGASSHVDRLKGSLSLEAEGKAGSASGSAKLDLAYEHNLSDGTSKGSGEFSAKGNLDLDGRRFEADGKGGLTVNWDKDHNIKSVSVAVEGTVAQGVKDSVKGADNGLSASSTTTTGTQGSVKIDIPYTQENQQLIQQYLQHAASNDTAGVAGDLSRLYDAGSATVQVNEVVTNKNEFKVDAKVVEAKVSTEAKVTQNVVTYYKVPNDGRLDVVNGKDQTGSGGW